MTRETLDRMAQDLAAEVSLPADDWEAIVMQAIAMQAWIKSLDELPLQGVEPATTSLLSPDNTN